jgi:hypothetical protein
MTQLGRMLIIFGVMLVVIGCGFVLLGKTNVPFGRLPGDIVYRGKNSTIYFPLATSILLSVVISIVLYVLGKMRR